MLIKLYRKGDQPILQELQKEPIRTEDNVRTEMKSVH